MSYNSEPDWAFVDISEIESIPCSKCGSFLSFIGEEEGNPLLENLYDCPRYIPAHIDLCCLNKDCSEYEEEVTFNLKAVVHVIQENSK